jgi:hypothetical protein
MSIALYLVVGLSALLDLALGAWASVAWRSFAGAWRLHFAESTGDPQLLGLVLGLALIFFAVLQGLALWWIRREKEPGHWVLISFGFYLILSSLITFLAFHSRFDFLLVDGLRGALLVVLATAVLRAPATVRELRLPERSRPDRPRRKAPGERGRGPREREERGRGGPGRRGRERRERPGSGAPRAEGGRLPSSRSGGGSDRGQVRAPRAAGPAETGAQDWSRRPLPASRAPEDLILADSIPPRRARGAGDEDRPLTVVVKGDPDSLRVRPLDEIESALDGTPRPLSSTGEGGPSSERHRRRRRRRSRGGERVERLPAGDEVTEGPEDEPGDEPSGRTEERISHSEDRDRGTGHVSGAVEALDMLSLLDPESDADRTTDSHPPGHEGSD